jgi:hypothetical protein
VKITIADLFPCDEGMIVVAKHANDGVRKHITDVPSGLACNCVCFGCGKRLVARKGEGGRAHSFAHLPDEVTPDCSWAAETELHIICKEIIARHGKVTFPEVMVPDQDGRQRLVSPKRCVEFASVEIEKPAGQVIPDVVATMHDGRRVFIEILNTHACPPEKLAKLSKMDVDVLEIDVSNYRDHALDELDEIVLHIAPRKVIQSAALRAMANRLEQEKAKRQSQRRAEADRLVAIYRDDRHSNHKTAALITKEMVDLGMSDLFDLDERPSAFIVPRRQWQAAIVYRLVDCVYPESVSVMDMVQRFRERKWEKPGLGGMKSEHSRWIAANVAGDFKSPYEEVLGYMERLELTGVVFSRPGKRFVKSNAFFERVKAVIERQQMPEKRTTELKAAFDAVCSLMLPTDGVVPSFGEWLNGRAAHEELSVSEFLIMPMDDWKRLLREVETIRAAIVSPRRPVPDDFVGLPLQGLFSRLKAERLEALHKAEDERAARLKDEADKRLTVISETAHWSIQDAAKWLAKGVEKFGGKTPLELAEESASGLESARDALGEEVARIRKAASDEQIRIKVVSQIEEAVRQRFQRSDEAEVWLRQSWPQLGRVRVADYCVDQKTLDRCLELLEESTASIVRRARRR